MTSKERARLIVFSRAWCHLCDDLLAALGPVCEELGADIEVVVAAHDDVVRVPTEAVLEGHRVLVLRSASGIASTNA